ncbi:MAG: hypothetical protein ABMA01_14640 [Chthoniobacteraceae bacterium]
MHAETFKELLHGQPFQPFMIHTTGGETYSVDRPDFVWLTRGGRTLYISLPGGEGERVRILNTSLIDWLETKEAKQPV